MDLALDWQHRAMWTGGNLDIIRGINSELIDLIYLDPPFNSNRNYAASIGSLYLRCHPTASHYPQDANGCGVQEGRITPP